MPIAKSDNRAGRIRGLPYWIWRHLGVIAVSAIATYLFMESRAEWIAMHRWNRALADTSLVLVALALAAGPMARLWPATVRLLPWRREAGIYGVALAFAHTAIILDGWVEWDLLRLFGYQLNQVTSQYVMVQHGFGLANVVGILALVYGLILGFTSNNRSQRFLGGSSWKVLQQGAYVLWVLVALHTAYFLYLHFQDFHREVPPPNWLQAPFIVLVLAVVVIRNSAFFKVWRSTARRARARAGEG